MIRLAALAAAACLAFVMTPDAPSAGGRGGFAVLDAAGASPEIYAVRRDATVPAPIAGRGGFTAPSGPVAAIGDVPGVRGRFD